MEYAPGAIRAAVIIKNEDKLLLVQEGSPKVQGRWNWPQGRVESGEELQAAAVREAKEETGLDVSIERKVAVLTHPFPGTKAIHVYLGTISGGDLKVSRGEILQARWCTLDEIRELKDQLCGAWVLNTISSL